MSNNYWDEEDDDLDTEIESTSNDGNNLVQKLRKAKRADEKRIKELTEQLETLSKGQRERTVKEVLEKQGVNLKAARLALKDLEEVSEETVMNWLDENGDLFGFSRQEDAPNVDEENLGEIRRQNSVTQGAKTPDRGEDLELRIDNAQSAEELQRILYSQ